MSFVAEHLVFDGNTRAIDFRFTSSNLKVDWSKFKETSKPIQLVYSEGVSVTLTWDYDSGYYSCNANFINSSNQTKSLTFKICGIDLSTRGTEKLVWGQTRKTAIDAGSTFTEQYYYSEPFYKLLTSDSFDVVVRIVEYQETKEVSHHDNTKRQWDWLSGIYQDDSFKDVKFLIGDQIIMAHKSVLAFHSEVFRSMLTLDTEERKKGVIQIKDCNAPAFKAFIKYLYTEEIDNIEDVADDLLVLGDKYDVQCLRKRCEKYLSDTINESNAISLLIKADMSNCQVLKNGAISFIKSRLNTFTPHIHELQQYPNLIGDIFRSLADDKDGVTMKLGALQLKK